MEKKIYSFAPGLEKLKVSDVKDAKRQIMLALRIKTPSYFSLKKRGITNISLQDYESVNAIFGKYGVKPSEVWLVRNA